MRRVRDERGFSLVELMIAMTLMLIVIGATLAVFATMERKSRDNQRTNDSERTARVAVDVMSKRLRNLASPQSSGAAPQALERANPTDVMFRTVDSTGTPPAGNLENLERYRYCLGTNNRLYAERQPAASFTATQPTTTGCGTSDGWPGTRSVVAQNVTNGARPVFKYQVSPTPGTYSEQSTVTQTNFPNDIAIRVELFVDPDTAHPPGEVTLNTRVFLRNQNRPPTATFSASYSGSFAVTFNASDSADPENNPLYYQWSDGGTVKQAFSQQATWSPYPAFAPNSSHTVTLVVRDIGGLQVTSSSKTITCDATKCQGPL
jgi:prepilin-type N-terminal cleavage/methylation domain-containing protein